MIVRETSPRLVRSGFTLMEMMIVIAIIVALAGLGIFYMAGQADEAYVAKAKADMTSLNQAVVSYRLKHPQRQYPTSLNDLVAAGLIKTTKDPWGSDYALEPGQGAGVPPRIYCNSPHGQIFPE